ncbi:tRNA pseudouridine(38/39) synthase [Venturia canescens]|uniref:tRNA pseudouridine(38/39) synthase n=1 Tax=Venturia canescens TaxID=32260 RepID=UPI001C9CEA9B|nr:tRNA pseudouridine(38/39) synthase [Venturia canescens]
MPVFSNVNLSLNSVHPILKYILKIELSLNCIGENGHKGLGLIINNNRAMADYVITKNTNSKNASTREELEKFDSSCLIDKILQLEAHNYQLRRIIKKAEDSKQSSLNKKSNNESAKPFDFSRCYKRHVLLKFFYLGWNYHGFVEQEDNNNTVEEHIFIALKRSCCIENRQTSNYHRCGRTDKGVSAFSQVISLDIRSRLEPSEQDKIEDELDYCRILNRLLPSDIRCYAWAPVQRTKSARFDCKHRTYKYFFPRGYLNIEAMNEAAGYIVGYHDFRNFCKMDVGNGVVRFDRKVDEAKVITIKPRESDEISGYDMYQFVIKSQAFLWHQIRCIMGVLLLVGQGKEKPVVVRDLLNVESCSRKPQYSLAHELPLNLYDCHFDDVKWIFEKNELNLVVQSLEKDWTINAVKSTMIREMLDDLKSHLDDEGPLKDPGHFSLLQGVQATNYQPLMKRLTCESLENRIEHYEKKRKIKLVEDTAIKRDEAMKTQS